MRETTQNAAATWLAAIPELAKQERVTSTDIDECIENFSHSLLQKEPPQLVNALLERACNLQCTHCLLPAHAGTTSISKAAGLDRILENLVTQLGEVPATGNGWAPAFLHEGRIVRPWHLEVMARLKESAPKVTYGLIDNGSYTQLLREFSRYRIQLDWLDISCDGTRESHNAQRDPRGTSYDAVLNGLAHAREIVKPQGRVTSLMTLTSLNYADIPAVAETLLGCSLVDELHVTTMSPKLTVNYTIDLEQRQVATAFEDVVKLSREQRVYFRLYNTKHLGYIAKHVGQTAMQTAFTKATAYDHGIIGLPIEGMVVYYAPSSLWPAEGIFVDVNGAQRVAYAQGNTLAQLEDPVHETYTVQQLTPNSSLMDAHTASVRQWANHFMKGFVKQEIAILAGI